MESIILVKLPQAYFPDPSIGRPISNGEVYIGVADLDPIANPIEVTAEQEDGTQFIIDQPIETGAGGVPLYNGSPVSLYVNQEYSMLILDKLGVQKYHNDRVRSAAGEAGVYAQDSKDYSNDSGSWANEDEDVPVKEYNDDVPTDRVPTVYSSKHWAAKAEATVNDRVPRTSTTGSAVIPSGDSLERDPVPTAGYFRFNEDLVSFEGYDGTSWGSVGGGASGAVNNPVFYENDTNVTGDYTITTGKNAMSAGPITIDDGVTVTVPDGSVWTIVGG